MTCPVFIYHKQGILFNTKDVGGKYLLKAFIVEIKISPCRKEDVEMIQK
jgi:hypothetical protein